MIATTCNRYSNKERQVIHILIHINLELHKTYSTSEHSQKQWRGEKQHLTNLLAVRGANCRLPIGLSLCSWAQLLPGWRKLVVIRPSSPSSWLLNLVKEDCYSLLHFKRQFPASITRRYWSSRKHMTTRHVISSTLPNIVMLFECQTLNLFICRSPGVSS